MLIFFRLSNTKTWKCLTLLIAVGCSGMMSYSRVYLQYHTVEQVWICLTAICSLLMVNIPRLCGEGLLEDAELSSGFFWHSSCSLQCILRLRDGDYQNTLWSGMLTYWHGRLFCWIFLYISTDSETQQQFLTFSGLNTSLSAVRLIQERMLWRERAVKRINKQ